MGYGRQSVPLVGQALGATYRGIFPRLDDKFKRGQFWR